MYAQHFIIRTHVNESYSIPDTLFHQNSQELRECFLIKAFRRDFILRITFLIGYTTSECTKTRRNLSLKNRSYISTARFACHTPRPAASRAIPLGLRPRSPPDKCDLEFTVLRAQNDADKPLFQ